MQVHYAATTPATQAKSGDSRRLASDAARLVEITRFAKTDGPLTKVIHLDAEGKLVSDGSECLMVRGTARRVRLTSPHELAALIGSLAPHEAIALGALRPDLPDTVSVTTRRRLTEASATAPNLIARDSEHISHRPGAPAFCLIDYDQKGMPPTVQARIDELGGFIEALLTIVPELKAAAQVRRLSTSSGLWRTDTLETIEGSGGVHLYVLIDDGADSERFLKALHERCWLAGLGWHIVGAGGQLLERSIVDRMVGSPERLVFEGPPVLVEPLEQDEIARRPVAIDGGALNTVAACPPLTIVEKARLEEMLARSAHQLAPESAKARQRFIRERALKLEQSGLSAHVAARTVERQLGGVLLPDLVLPFDDPELAGKTVADVLADPARFEGETLADPIEGVSYGAGKAKIMRRPHGDVFIHSFAHGGMLYELRHGAASIRKAIEAAPEHEAAHIFIGLAADGDLDPDEEEALRDLAATRSGTARRVLDKKLKSRKIERSAQRAKAERNRRLAERNDPRPSLDAPVDDAAWLPVMATLDTIFASKLEGKGDWEGDTSTAGIRHKHPGEPPMRNADGWLCEIRTRAPNKLHTLCSGGANAEASGARLPPAEQPLITQLSEAEVSDLVERYADFRDPKTGRSVHLSEKFVRHYMRRQEWGEGGCPRVSGVSALPLVMPDGTLLAGKGLNRKYEICFRIPDGLPELLPAPKDCDAAAVARAMRFLCDEWLCDVATDFHGKCVLIAAALTVIERALLPDRPVFWVTAGKRGGGKTTALNMLLMAVTGVRPAAAAWSSSEEERRKSLLAYLMEGLPAVVWDNIPRGAQISCPHIEKAATSAYYVDRRLGASETVTANAATVLLFTGNNIGPKGDLASRSLAARIEVDRPDPENRQFRHTDPLGWTEANRGAILAALFTVLLGNPRLRVANPPPAETRFKTWYHLVGAAVENAARAYGGELRFRDLFLSQEGGDEESSSLADALSAMAAVWPSGAPFSAADLARQLNAHNDTMLDDAFRERAAGLREFFFPTRPAALTVTAKAAAKALKPHIGAPVPRGDRVFALRTYVDPHSKNTLYRVDAKPKPR